MGYGEFFKVINKWLKENKVDKGYEKFLIMNSSIDMLIKKDIYPSWVLMDGKSYKKLIKKG